MLEVKVVASNCLPLPVDPLDMSHPQDRASILQDIKTAEPTIKLLFITPELLSTEGFLGVLKSMDAQKTLSLLAVDEAHCISSWGHDFRPAYRKLGMVRQQLPGVPIMALTATATSQVSNKTPVCALMTLKNSTENVLLSRQDSMPAYRKLGMGQQQPPGVPIMALTATATSQVGLHHPCAYANTL